MGKTVSAIPSKLTGWETWAGGLNSTLSARARALDTKLAALNNSKPDSSVFSPVAYIGEDIAGYAARNGKIDSWVGDVGRAIFGAGTKNIPGPIRNANYEDLWNGRYTVDQKTVDALAGKNPISEADAMEKAAELREAVDRGDGARVRAIAESLKGHEDDPDYTSTFFSTLGPKYTLKAVKFMDDESDPDQDAALKSWDTALGTATRSPDWDPDFNSQIYPKLHVGDDPLSHEQVLLLKYGTYSQDMLEKAADAEFFRGFGNKVGSEHDMAIVLRALSRNPDAAAHWFNGHVPANMQSTGNIPDNHTRLQDLVTYYYLHGNYWKGELGAAMGAAIVAAAQGPNAKSVLKNLMVVDKEGDLMPSQYLNGLRGSLAKAVSNNIPLLVQLLGSKGDAGWAKQLVHEAIADENGNVDEGKEKEIVDAMAKYAAGQFKGMGSDLIKGGHVPEAWLNTQDRVNSLLSVMFDAIDSADKDRAHRQEMEKQFWGTVLDLIPIPGGKLIGEGVEKGADISKEMVVRIWEYYKGQHDEHGNESEADQEKDLVMAGVRGAMARQFVAEHPDVVPPGEDPDKYAEELAEGKDYSQGLSRPKTKEEQGEVDDFVAYIRGVHVG